MEIKVKELQLEERPREKALQYGVASLSNRDLIAILLRTGYHNVSVLQLADELINKCNGIVGLCSIDYHELIKIKGISHVKAIELVACLELSKRISQQQLKNEIILDNPKAIAQYFNQKIGFEMQEHFAVLYLGVKNQILHDEVLFIGTLNASIVHTREIFKHAMKYSSASIVVVHNHPSGECIPSENDLLVTSNIQQVGELVGIHLLDHIIVGRNNYFSLKEHQLMI